MPGMLVIGAPTTIGEEGARLKLWWDYDIIARRVIGRQNSHWSADLWARVTEIALGALATSRRVFLGASGYEVFEHPYIRAQREQGLVALLTAVGRARHGLLQAQALTIGRDLITAAAHLDIPVLESLEDARLWILATEKANEALRNDVRRNAAAHGNRGLRDVQQDGGP